MAVVPETLRIPPASDPAPGWTKSLTFARPGFLVDLATGNLDVDGARETAQSAPECIWFCSRKLAGARWRAACVATMNLSAGPGNPQGPAHWVQGDAALPATRRYDLPITLESEQIIRAPPR